MKKPNPATVRAAVPLTAALPRGADPLAQCNLCGELGELEAHRECDEWDRPIPGTGALVFLGVGHAACKKQLQVHPRLYVDARGDPGSFPKLCGPCTWREGFRCKHPKLKANGGEGLLVQIGTAFAGMRDIIICTREGCWRPPQIAKSCEGRRLLRLVKNTGAEDGATTERSGGE